MPTFSDQIQDDQMLVVVGVFSTGATTGGWSPRSSASPTYLVWGLDRYGSATLHDLTKDREGNQCSPYGHRLFHNLLTANLKRPKSIG